MKSILRIGLALACAAAGLCACASGGALEAGVGRAVITPKQDMWLSGYASRTAPSDGKIHDLFAKALAIRDSTGARSVIVTTDLIGLPRGVAMKVAELARERHGLPRERLMLTSSHTHCGPVIGGNLSDMFALDEEQARRVREYTDALPELLAGAIGEALRSLEPCKIYWGAGSAGFAINRRQPTPKGIQLGVNEPGPVDRSVPTLKVVRRDGSLKAALFGYACHNTTLSFQKICGDYAGFAQAKFEERNPGATALFVMGCGGDANPHPRGELALAEKHGEELAQAVEAVLRGPMREARGPLRAAFKEIPLALSEPPTREALEKQKADPNVYVQRRAKSLIAKLDRDGKLDATYPYPVQAWRFAEGPQLTALGGEVVVDYSLRIKKELGAESQFVIAYANDVMAYIPSLRVLKEGGYEAADAMIYYGLYGPWSPAVEESIMAATRELAGAVAPPAKR